MFDNNIIVKAFMNKNNVNCRTSVLFTESYAKHR